MKFTLKQGNGTIEGGAAVIFSEALKSFSKHLKSVAGKALKKCIGNWWQKRFPGSKHYTRSKIKANRSGSVSIGVAGVSRAFHDVDIFPVNAKSLAIPLRPEAQGKSPRAFEGLFKPKGKNILAKNEGGTLVAYYALSKHVH